MTESSENSSYMFSDVFDVSHIEFERAYAFFSRCWCWSIFLYVFARWDFMYIFFVCLTRIAKFFERVLCVDLTRSRLSYQLLVPICWWIFTCNVCVLDVDIYPYMAGELTTVGKPYDEPYVTMCATRMVNYVLKCAFSRVLFEASSKYVYPFGFTFPFYWWNILFFPVVCLLNFPYYYLGSIVWILPHSSILFSRVIMTWLSDIDGLLRNQSGVEPPVCVRKHGVVEVHLFVPVRTWSPQHDRLVFFNFRTWVGSYLVRRYDTDLDITVSVSHDRPHVVINATLEESIEGDCRLEDHVQHFNNFLSGLYQEEFAHVPLDIFWHWNLFEDQSGRENKKQSRKDHSKRISKKEKKDALVTFDEYPDYLLIRRGILNIDKLVIDPEALDNMTPVCLKKKMLKIGKLMESVMSARERIDRRLNLPLTNQAGDDSRFSIDDIFGNDNQFTRAISLVIDANCSHLSVGDSAKLLLQISLWSYELVTAESLYALMRKIILLSTYGFPDVCSRMLEGFVGSLFPKSVNQAGMETFAVWTRELAKMWKDSNSQLVGHLKKMALIGAAGAVFGAGLESYSPVEILSHIVKPSQAEIDKTSTTDIITYFLESLRFMTQAAADAVSLGDPLMFFRLRDPATIVNDDMVEIMDYYNRFHTYGLSMLTITVEELRSKCVKTKELLKTCQGNPKLGGLVTTRTLFYNLDRVIAECDAGFKCKPLNEQPFVICAFGMPETGKSGITTVSWQSIAISNGYDCSPTQTCHINPADKYQSTADGQRHVHLDDINQALGTKPDSVNNSMLLLRMANQVPFFTNQAELGKKGNNVLAPKVITMTSQTVHLYAHEDVHEPGAIHRRVTLYVEVLIKPEYSTAGGSIDHNKLNGSTDIHLLNVTRPVAVGITSDGKQIIRHQYVVFDFEDGNGPIALHKISVKQYCHALVFLYKEHMARESRQLDRVITVDVCEHKMPAKCCYLCEVNQSDGNVHLAEQKQLVGSFVSYPKPLILKRGKARTSDEDAHMMNVAAVEEEALENHAGFDLETLYYVALFVPTYLWSLPRLSVSVGPWWKPMCWYGNFVHSHWIEKFIGWKGKVVLPALVSGVSTFVPLYLFAPLWSIGILFGSLVSIPFVAHDLFMYKVKDWTSRQLLAFESRFRYLKWVSNRKNQAVAGMVAVMTGVITFIAYNLLFKKDEDDGMLNNGGNYSNLTSALATVKPTEWEKPVHVTEYVQNTGNFTRQQLIGGAEGPGMILRATSYCVDEARKSTNAFPICGNYWLFPLHYMQTVVGRVNFHRVGTAKNGTRFSWLPGPEGILWRRLPGHDIALCFVTDLPPQKDLRKLLSDQWSMPPTGLLLFKCIDYPSCEVTCNTISVILHSRGISSSSDDRCLKYPSVSYTLVGANTRGGMCMSPIIGDQKHPTILGFHTKGSAATGRADILTLSELEVGIGELSQSPLTLRPVSSDEMRLVGGVNMEVHPKHVGRFVPDMEGVTFLGCANAITRRMPKMHTKPTPIYEQVLNQFGIEDKWQGPPVKPSWLAHHKMMCNLSNPATPDPSLVARAAEDYSKQLCEHFESHPTSLKQIRKMTLDEALMGVPGVPGFESLNMNTSKGHVGVLFPGYTNGGKKSDVLEVKYEDENGKACFQVTCPEKLLSELEELTEQAKGLQRIGFVSALNHKDETLKKTKECARLFSALPLHFILLQRIYFLSFTKWFRDWNFVTECAVGINATSPLWHTFGLFMQEHSEGDLLSNIAGDYQAFDQRSVAMFLICCYNVILSISKMSGFSEEDLNVMSVLMIDLIYPIFDFNSDLVMPNGGNPSGHSLTVIINSIMNSLYMRYVFYSVLPHLVKFQSHVNLLTYGDDNMMSVARAIRDTFNQNTISAELSKIGIVYTDAHKSQIFDDFISFDKVTFLKRSFVFREEFGQYMAPIEMDSIMKSLLYHIPSKAEGVLVEHQIAQTLVSASDEIFLHGEDVFLELQPKLEELASNYGIRHMMIDRFYDNYTVRVSRWHEIYDDQKFVEQSGICDYVLQLEAEGPGKTDGLSCDKSQTQFVRHDVRVRASSVCPGFQNQRHHLPIGYLIIFVALLLPRMVMALEGCKIMQLGKFVDSQYFSEINWVTEMKMSTRVGTLQQTLDFADGTPQPSVSYKTMLANETTAMSTGDLQLGEFFSRPILLTSISWTPDLAGFGTSFDPWSMFFGNKRVINRINNFNLLSANLHIKAVVNGNGFYYGRAMMDYIPLYVVDGVSQFNLSNKTTLVNASQRLHLQIDPTTSSGGEMVLPFIWHYDKISIPSASWSSLGTMFIREMNLLKHANAATTPIEINIYAWAEDVELSIPTASNSSALINQSGDEYGLDKFQEMATALASTADSVNPTTIGSYVRASQLAVSGLGKLANMMGFSRPPDNDSVPFRRKIVTNLANTDAHDGSVKLAVDSKQELSVGCEPINVSTGDELDIATICAKQTLIAQAYWDLTHAVGDPLFYSKVSPMLHATEAIPVNFYPSAMMYAALPFRFWRGKVKFRFQVVASSFHRGRLLVTWNPTTTASQEVNVVCSTIIDLDKERECVLEIPWGQVSSFLTVPAPVVATKGWLTNPGAAVLPINNTYDNGIVSVYVINTLAVPNTTATALVGINVYVSMEEAQFAVPDDVAISNISFTANQSGVEPDIEVPMPINVDTTRALEDTAAVDTLMMMYMGERITSFRTLLKRYVYHMSTVIQGTAATNRCLRVTEFSAFPYYQGTRANGIYTGVNTCRTTFINFLTPCFLAQRGGIRIKLVNANVASSVCNRFMSVRRTRGLTYTNTATSLTSTPTEAQVNAEASFAYAGSGLEVTDTNLQGTLEFEVPFQKQIRFCAAKNIGNTTALAPVSEHVHFESIGLSNSATDNLQLLHYVSAAEDFSLLLWQGAPAFTYVTLP